jgi:DNA-binding NarL/FixJ family response regulator
MLASAALPSLRTTSGCNGCRRIYLLQNHPLMIRGTRSFIDSQDDLKVCGSALVPEETLTNLPNPQPDAIVYELCIHGPFDFSFLKKVRQQLPGLPILAYSYHEEVIFAQRALDAGASGYLMKETAPGRLAAAIRQIVNGELYLSERMWQRLELEKQFGDSLNGSLVKSLTNRELEIFQALGEEFDDESIAARTGLSSAALATAQYRMRKKLGLQNRAELVQFALHWAYYEGDFA